MDFAAPTLGGAVKAMLFVTLSSILEIYSISMKQMVRNLMTMFVKFLEKKSIFLD